MFPNCIIFMLYYYLFTFKLCYFYTKKY